MDVKVSPMERRTLSALDSANPFQTPVRPPASLDGRKLAKMPDPEPDPIEQREVEGDDMIDLAVESKGRRRRRPKAALEEIKEPEHAEVTVPIQPIETVEDSEPFQNPITQTYDQNGMPSYRCEFAGRDIFVGLPWYTTSNPVTTMALVAMALDFGKDRIRFDCVTNTEIYVARNLIAKKFLETDAKWLFMLDHDIIPSIGRAAWYKSWVESTRGMLDQPLLRHVLHRLLGAGKTLVGAAYFGRQEGAKLMCSDQSLVADARAFADRVAPVDWIGAGCVMVHRKVFEDIDKTQPDLRGSYFLPTADASEDIAFCRRAKKVGHQCHIDLGVPVKHLGYKTY